MKTTTQCFAALLTFCCLFASPLYAAKAPTVDICHWDDDTGEFKLKKINGNAQKGHLGHGDELPGADPETTSTPLNSECVLVVNAPLVIARAYINVDRTQGYDDNIDIPIAEIFDVDLSGTVSIGDKLTFGQVPASFNPCPLIDSAPQCTEALPFKDEDDRIVTEVLSSDDSHFYFSYLSTDEEEGNFGMGKAINFESLTIDINGNFLLSLQDKIDNVNVNILNDSIDYYAPGETPIIEYDMDKPIADDYFFDVELPL